MTTKKCLLVLFGILSMCISCSKHGQTLVTDSTRNYKYDSIKYYKDSIIYLFNSTLIAKADNQTFNPIHFKIKLPKDLKFYKASGLDNFGFFYDNKESLFVLIRHNKFVTDTIYDPEEMEIDNILDQLITVNPKGKFDLRKNDFDHKRQTKIIKKGVATILLYNITNSHRNQFIEYASQFKFL